MAGVPLGLVLLVAAPAAFAALEFAVRVLRLADYPLFVRSDAFGYGFRPDAHGSMRRRFRWRTNAMGLRIDHDRKPAPDSIVLVGDSTVESGVHVDQAGTLAAWLAHATGRDVHPIACPAWTLENQLAFLREHPELYRAGTIMVVSNSESLVALARWQSESAQPTRRPPSHAWYKLMRLTWLWRRRLFPWLFPPWPDDADRTWEESVRTFLERYDGRLIWLFYPWRHEPAEGIVPCARLRPLIEDRAETFEIAAMPGWNSACYADRVHPNARGREVLLAALLEALGRPPGVPRGGSGR